MGGIKLRIYTEDLPKAAVVIKEIQRRNPPQQYSIGECPACKSKKIKLIPWPKWDMIVALIFLGIPYLFTSHRKCYDCGNTWWE